MFVTLLASAAMRLLWLVVLALLALAPARAGASVPAFTDGHGLHVAAEQQLDARLLSLTVTTAALPSPAHVRILLPDGYDQHPAQRYPVLYLLHGTSGGAADWTTMGNAEATTAGRPLIVVMPDIALNDDGGGWCTNWHGGVGPHQWETFHIDELIPWIDAGLRTIDNRDGRAIAGLSQGGFCSMSYAARHPDLFGTALSFSGAPDVAYGPDAVIGTSLIVGATEVALDGQPLASMFGDRLSAEINWAAHDPATLATNLRHTNLFMYAGNGRPGPLDPPKPDPGASAIEMLAGRDTQDFHDRLVALGIPSVYQPYGAGTHTWGYWARDLEASIGPLMDDFAHPLPAPAAVDYTSAENHFAVYGWDVAMNRGEQQLATLSHATADGFELSGGIGDATVTTAPVFAKDALYIVTVNGAQRDVISSADGRLQMYVPLPATVTIAH
jgi:S-formylglutathione hydrolase FrmB